MYSGATRERCSASGAKRAADDDSGRDLAKPRELRPAINEELEDRRAESMIIELQSCLKRVLRSSTLAMVPAATFASTATVGLVYPAAA